MMFSYMPIHMSDTAHDNILFKSYYIKNNNIWLLNIVNYFFYILLLALTYY